MNRYLAAALSAATLLFAFTLASCGSGNSTLAPLNAGNINLIFVVSQDLPFHGAGEVSPTTGNLTGRGLRRTLLTAGFLKDNVLGGQNATSIYALEPMTHLQTSNNYPDMTALAAIQQFAMLNQTSITGEGSGHSFPVFASYTDASKPRDVPAPVFPCPECQGLDFDDSNGENETLVTSIIQANVPGFYVFSAPWETMSALMTNINQLQGYHLDLPATYNGPGYIYAISIKSSGKAALVAYNTRFDPPSSYPPLPAGYIRSAACTGIYSQQVVGGVGGAVVPANANTNETVYMVRHAEAHPTSSWDDGNYIGTGQWRALDLPYALEGKIRPTEVWAADSSIAIPGGDGSIPSSYVRPSMTVLPYAIANDLPFNLAATVPLFAEVPPAPAPEASAFFFTGDKFTNKTILVGWEHKHIPSTVNALLASYGVAQNAPDWSDADYDSIWKITLDAHGNLNIDNQACEGIDTSGVPPTAPIF